jgi:hypothetical protein
VKHGRHISATGKTLEPPLVPPAGIHSSRGCAAEVRVVVIWVGLVQEEVFHRHPGNNGYHVREAVVVLGQR